MPAWPARPQRRPTPALAHVWTLQPVAPAHRLRKLVSTRSYILTHLPPCFYWVSLIRRLLSFFTSLLSNNTASSQLYPGSLPIPFFFFFNDPAPPEISPFPLPDALPIGRVASEGPGPCRDTPGLTTPVTLSSGAAMCSPAVTRGKRSG